MSQIRASLALTVLIALLVAPKAFAGAKVAIDDESKLDIGFRVQTLGIVTDELDKDGEPGKTVDFKVRRGRLRVKGIVTSKVSAFIQTDVGGTDNGAGQSARVIDAFVTMAPDPWFQFYMGLNMAPSNRQNLTSSGSPMTMDRPGMAYKTLNWGGRMLRTFSNNTISGTASGLSNGTAVRDLGITLFGSGKAGDNASFKYYVGVYDGVNASGTDNSGSTPATIGNAEDTPHVAARAQINFFDAEGGYYNAATYLGKKKTVGIGASVDMQTDVAARGTVADPVMVDYLYYTVDGFVEWPVENGSFTAEAAWMMLDYDDAAGFLAAQGNGFYAQAGYLVNNWQPWGEFEMWTSDATDDTGSVNQFRVGVTRYLKGHNANIKAGYEMTTSDQPILGAEDSVDAFVFGLYTTY
ncbi:OprO/OprP family phosphate-selective porin, partial [bacterium]|nr:OprO/OprP family phosphate-selective porin [bacterium]